MSTSTSATSATSSSLASLGLTSQPSASSGSATNTLSQSDFLKLMTSQMTNQDPLNPLSNNDLLTQMAQLSTVTGINSLNTSFSTLSSQLSSNQALEASSLVGKSVMVQSATDVLGPTGMSGAIGVPSSGDVQVQISDSTGALVKTIDLGTQSSGIVNFNWDGKDASGTALAAGTYSLNAQVIGASASTAATTYAVSTVQSVAIDSNSIYVNLDGLGTTAFNKVVEIL